MKTIQLLILVLFSTSLVSAQGWPPSGGGGSGANQSLSNLTSPTAINEDLLFGSDGSNNIGASGASRPGTLYCAAGWDLNSGQIFANLSQPSDEFITSPAIMISSDLTTAGTPYFLMGSTDTVTAAKKTVNVVLTTGDNNADSGGTAVTGNLYLNTGSQDNSGSTAGSGYIIGSTGLVADGSGQSGDIDFSTGEANGISGAINLSTGDSDTTGSGLISIISGNASIGAGNSGAIELTTGSANSGIRGEIILNGLDVETYSSIIPSSANSISLGSLDNFYQHGYISNLHANALVNDINVGDDLTVKTADATAMASGTVRFSSGNCTGGGNTCGQITFITGSPSSGATQGNEVFQATDYEFNSTGGAKDFAIDPAASFDQWSPTAEPSIYVNSDQFSGQTYILGSTDTSNTSTVTTGVTIQSGNNDATSGNVGTGDINIYSGDVSESLSTGTSGNINMNTGGTQSADSGEFDLATGATESGNSGVVDISSGATATAGNTGNIDLHTGLVLGTGTRGNVILTGAYVDASGSTAVLLKVQGSGDTPTCGASQNGALTLTSGYVLCVCNGSGWVHASTGATSCTF